MYKAAVNFLRGQVLVHIESGCPERVVNLCAGAEVPFWDVQWLSPVELTLRTTRRTCWPGGCGGGMCCWRRRC